MPNKPPKYRSQPSKVSEARRANHRRHPFYNSRWTRAAKAFRQQNPLCVECKKQGKITAAEMVDHKIPWKSKPVEEQQEFFWCVENWQSLCDACHRTKSIREGSWF